MSGKVITPEAILPDDVNRSTIAGVDVRKGTIAAIVANASLLESESVSEGDKKQAMAMIEKLAPAAVAIGLHHHVTWKNKKMQAIFDVAARSAAS